MTPTRLARSFLFLSLLAPAAQGQSTSGQVSARDVPRPTATRPAKAEPAPTPSALDTILPEVKFHGAKLEEVLDFLQDQTKDFRAVVIRQPGAEQGPEITLRLRNVSLGQLMEVITTAYGNVLEVLAVDGPRGPVQVVTVHGPDNGVAPGPNGGGGLNFGGAHAAEAERSVRVYRLTGIIEDMVRRGADGRLFQDDAEQAARATKQKEALNNILSLVKSALQLTDPREAPTLQVHEETQTLIFKGSAPQRLALEDVLSAMESHQAVRSDTPSERTKDAVKQARAEAEQVKFEAKAEADRLRKDADLAQSRAMKQLEMEDHQLQEMNAQLRAQQGLVAELKARLEARAEGGGTGNQPRPNPGK
jgi:hypothetical protein